ncbi:MAG: hypothetical protein WKF36_07305 [Candidatus Nitrosocosmicus sp.]
MPNQGILISVHLEAPKIVIGLLYFQSSANNKSMHIISDGVHDGIISGAPNSVR